MTQRVFQDLRDQLRSGGTSGFFSLLQTELRGRHDYHRLFDALLLQKKFELGLPWQRPTSLDDVPDGHRAEVERTYIQAARDVGHLFLADNKLNEAYLYLNTIRELTPLKQALEAYPIPRESSDEVEQIIGLALYKGVSPAKGVALMLKVRGICNTITALDQQFGQLSTTDRAECAALMVRTVYHDLIESVKRDVQQRMPFAPPTDSLRGLITGRDWLFADGNYHLDVSHLHSVVRFARSLTEQDPEVSQALELAEYGAQLTSQYQYPGDPPFEDYYPAHIEFFRCLQPEHREQGLAYFQRKLAATTDPQDRVLVAFVLVDLLVRAKRYSEAIPLADEYLVTADPEFSAAFTELCQESRRFDALEHSAERRGDLVNFAGALLEQTRLR